MNTELGYEIIDFSRIPAVDCPCGVARRALYNEPRVPYSLHQTEISVDAKTHYHRKTTETYVILECDPESKIELDGQAFPLSPHTAIVILPGTRHRAVGKMKVVIIAVPKFDPADEWFD